ncbi:MAG: cyclic lactone autoinducer peptide [bacterium]|nr:cyclic lactone autoinducer peptide [bacterium]
MKYFALALGLAATTVATVGTQACTMFILEEPIMPKNLLEK